MTTPRCGLLFHFTHQANLPTILERGALLSDTIVCELDLLSTEAGDPEVKERRRRRPVTCPPGGVVGDYVPFYFAPRSPMMYVLWKHRVPSFTGDHHDLAYFVSHVDTITAAGVEFAISDRNAAKAVADSRTTRVYSVTSPRRFHDRRSSTGISCGPTCGMTR